QAGGDARPARGERAESAVGDERRVSPHDELAAARRGQGRERRPAARGAARHAEPPRAPSGATDRVSATDRSAGSRDLRTGCGRSAVRLTLVARPMAIAYEEWPPGDALRGTILTFWAVEGDGSSVRSPTVLPDAYVEIVVNRGDAVRLLGPAFAGRQPARVVV